jgi:hypothetical protein
MMERKRAEHDVVFSTLSEEEHIALFEIDLRIVRAQAARDFQRGALLIDRIHCDGGTDFSGVVDDETRDIPGTSRQIKYPQLDPGLDPASQKTRDKRMASKVAIKLAQVAQIAHELGGHRLRPVHQLWLGRIKLPLH